MKYESTIRVYEHCQIDLCYVLLLECSTFQWRMKAFEDFRQCARPVALN